MKILGNMGDRVMRQSDINMLSVYLKQKGINFSFIEILHNTLCHIRNSKIKYSSI